jgi:hypothetical protein
MILYSLRRRLMMVLLAPAVYGNPSVHWYLPTKGKSAEAFKNNY